MWLGEQPVWLLSICYLASAVPGQLQPDWPLQPQPSCSLISCNQPIRALYKVSPPNTPGQSIVSQTSSVALSLAKDFSSSLLSLPCLALPCLVLFELFILPSPALISALSVLFCSAPDPV
ncbi:hypothetical protein XELAEV_18031661mg [Xenopus laevis]|uniref:Uncharacterized protein n=1 Tax=Xenopus laevis TaxID=8355 RepID=A0A974HFW5_XENLA|nr:hypothetical protein XELAEV_18031661mg [Xenopus laevis]